MEVEPEIDEVIAALEAHFVQSHDVSKGMFERRKEVIEREFLGLRELWWGFDPLELRQHREIIEDEYDSYVVASYLALRDEIDLMQMIRDSLIKMAREKSVSDEQIADFGTELRVWWATQSL